MSFDPRYCPQHLYFQNRGVLLNDENYVYRLREHPEKDDPDYVLALREPNGPNEACELSDTFYFTPEAGKEPRVSGYHEHRKGFEMFMVGGEGAKCLIKSRGRQTMAYPGDIVFLPPATPHGFEWYGNPLRWREMFSGMLMNEGGNTNWRILEFAPNAHEEEEFEQLYQSHSDYISHDYETHFASEEQIPEVIRFEDGAARFDLCGVKLLQKITRAQWWGQREVWQFHLPKGFTISCSHVNDKELILMVYSGRVRVRIQGVEEFVAKPWDYINIPSYLAAELTVLDEEAVVFDYNCTGYLFAALEELKMRAVGHPELLHDVREVRRVLKKNGVYAFGSGENRRN